VWSTIPVLRQLDLEFCDVTLARQLQPQLSPALAVGVSRCTQLTRLYGWFEGGRVREADALQMLSDLRQLGSLELCIVGEEDSLQSFQQLFSRSLTRLNSFSLQLGPLQQLALAQLCFQATQVTQLVLCESLTSQEGLVMLTSTMTQLRQLALISCDVPVGAYVPALGPSYLPHLEQLTICDITSFYESGESASLAFIVSRLQQVRPCLKVCGVQSRREIPPGFIGAFVY
jgi:hypothetical protein